jgi:hypothetical protein
MDCAVIIPPPSPCSLPRAPARWSPKLHPPPSPGGVNVHLALDWGGVNKGLADEGVQCKNYKEDRDYEKETNGWCSRAHQTYCSGKRKYNKWQTFCHFYGFEDPLVDELIASLPGAIHGPPAPSIARCAVIRNAVTISRQIS